jgi:hypothetical protein
MFRALVAVAIFFAVIATVRCMVVAVFADDGIARWVMVIVAIFMIPFALERAIRPLT